MNINPIINPITLILGQSGAGKTCSLRNLDPAKTLLIQTFPKVLPFRAAGWKIKTGKTDSGNIFVSPDPTDIIKALQRSTQEIVVIDDFQYVFVNLFMKKAKEKGYDKYAEIAAAGEQILNAASKLPVGRRVYFMAHATTDDFGRTHMMTIGKMLDEKLVIEGRFGIVLMAEYKPDEQRYVFRTRSNGMDTVRSPLGLFEESDIDNDLAAVDRAFCSYYDIPIQPTLTTIKAKPAAETAQQVAA